MITFDKAQTKTMLEKAIAREEIKDEVFTPFYEEMFKPQKEGNEEGKEEGKVEPVDKAGPMTFANAMECSLRYAVFIKMIPSRLKTALDAYKDDFTMPERQLYDFFKSDSLTDVTLIHPTTGAFYK